MACLISSTTLFSLSFKRLYVIDGKGDYWDIAGHSTNRYTFDAGVGRLGLGATGAVYLGSNSNPIGWGIVSGVLIYSDSRLAYDLYNKP